MRDQSQIISFYNQKIEKATLDADQLRSLSQRYSMIRLAIFILAIPALYFLIKTNMIILITSLILIGCAFVLAVIKQQESDQKLREKESLIAINQNEVDSLSTFSNLYFNGSDYLIPGHRYTDDLDIFGEHSIFGLINRCRTYQGNQNLQNLFTQKPTKQALLERQDAIEELSEAVEWRQDVATQLYPIEGLEQVDVAEKINRQIDVDLSWATGTMLNGYRKALPLIWLLIAGLYFYSSSIANTLTSVVFLGNLALTARKTEKINEVQGRLANTSRALRSYVSVLKSIFAKSWKSPLLQRHARQFEKSSSDLPISSLSQLAKIIDQLDYRLNFLVAIAANGLILWDIGVINKLSKWADSNDGKITKIFDHIGFIEAMNSLASWSFNHPKYSYPKIIDKYLDFEAIELAHPLIPSDQNIANNFAIDPKDKVVIITGSNMSGKSTLLRTIGINMILGYTGTKVAAEQMTMPILYLVTYMRIKDALEENVSTFKAELNRIEKILGILKTETDAFVLIDEMLRGTNSKDKLNGSIGITRKLLESHAYAMIATHDIKLAEMGADEERIANYYFDIDYKDGDLVFDYKVKEGICENFNASFLLGKLGIKT